MIIGLDLDNTIVCYDQLFRDVALERSLLPPAALPSSTPATKTAVRDFFRAQEREEEWTRLQGAVYGAEMHRAAAFAGFEAFVALAHDQGCRLHVVSHRTRQPYLGPEYDLHEAARSWLADNAPQIAMDNIYLESTREAKMDRIAQLSCHVFIDDLPELLADDAFPANVKRIWFNPDSKDFEPALECVAGWDELGEYLGLK